MNVETWSWHKVFRKDIGKILRKYLTNDFIFKDRWKLITVTLVKKNFFTVFFKDFAKFKICFSPYFQL